MLTICLDYLNRKEEQRRAAPVWSREDPDCIREIKERAAISRLSGDDQTVPKQQMEEQKAVMVCDISLFSAVIRLFSPNEKSKVKLKRE